MNIVTRPVSLNLEVGFTPLPPLGALEALWRLLESRAAGSFFNSWSWIGPWLRTYAAPAHAGGHLGLLTATCQGRTVGLGILARERPPLLIPGLKHTLHLHQTGRADDASAFIEYNALLLDKGMAAPTARAVLDFVTTADVFNAGPWAWTRFKIAAAVPIMREIPGAAPRIDREERCAWVDLARMPAGIDGYLFQLSPNTRGQVRRALRLFEERGPLVLTRAATLADARTYLEELRVLHEAGWQRRGKDRGAFNHENFGAFIREMLALSHGSGGIDLLKLKAGHETVGLLLNFIHGGHVYAYQSGLAHFDDNRLKPGLAAHALALSRYAEAGYAGYHFMAGAARYKTSLGTETETLSWLEFRRDTLALRIEDGLRALKARFT